MSADLAGQYSSSLSLYYGDNTKLGVAFSNIFTDSTVVFAFINTADGSMYGSAYKSSQTMIVHPHSFKVSSREDLVLAGR